jgi:RNA polymerase sigma-70 factor (ECF subfamily)
MNPDTETTTATATESTLNPDAWVDAYGDYLFHFAVGQVRDERTAEDLVQETLLGAFKARESFRGTCSERTWLTGILRNKIYDHLRRACRERAVRQEPLPASEENDEWSQSALWLHDVAAECGQPARRMELGEFREALELALRTLPPRVAQVFQLYTIDELPGAEVCARLNVSESNLWVMLHRARKQLREHLAAWRNS